MLQPETLLMLASSSHRTTRGSDAPSRIVVRGGRGNPKRKGAFGDEKGHRRRCTRACEEADRELCS